MQLNINTSLKISICIILFAFIILVSCLIITITKTWHIKSMNKELLEGIVCKDGIINEFTKIRHEYNNILQTITCLIEEEDLDGLKTCKSEYLNKAHLLNSNSIAQMAKIKDINILQSVYKLLLNAKEDSVILKITVYNEIVNQRLNSDEIYYILKECLINAYQSGAKDTMLINLKISSNDNGLCFDFENESHVESRKLFSQTLENRKNHANNKAIFNTFYQDTSFKQEILISFNR